VFYFSNGNRPGIKGTHISQFILTSDKDHIESMLSVLFDHQIGHVLIEGGAYLLQQFIDRDAWDEAWVIRSAHTLDHGIKAPNVRGRLLDQLQSESDTLVGIQRKENQESSLVNPV
jgi:riboflavin biosynthesis pyrimidine reductase